MKKLLLIFMVILFSIPNVFGQANQKNIIINELSQGSNTHSINNVDEWIELLVTADHTDIQGVYLDVDGNTNTLGNTITVQLSSSYMPFQDVSKGSIIVIYNSAQRDPNLPATDDLDFADGTLLIPSDNATYLSTTGWRTSKASGDAVGLFNPKSGSTVEGIMAISWGNFTNFPTTNFANGWGYSTISSVLTPADGIKYLGGTTSGVATNTNWIMESDINSTPKTTNGGSNDALPVALNTFNATYLNSVVKLTWTTATEVNNYGFNVERSSANSGWQKIGFVAGSGNSNSPKEYSFTDNPSGATSFSYRLKQIDVDGTFKYYDAVTVNLMVSEEPQLLQNSPNPFNPSTTIKFYTPNTSDVTIKIYDMLGREVATLINQQTTAGYHIVYWNGKDGRGENVASGIYLYRLTAGSFSETKKMNLLK